MIVILTCFLEVLKKTEKKIVKSNCCFGDYDQTWDLLIKIQEYFWGGRMFNEV